MIVCNWISVQCAVKLSAVIVGQCLSDMGTVLFVVTSSSMIDPGLPSDAWTLSQLPRFPSNMFLHNVCVYIRNWVLKAVMQCNQYYIHFAKEEIDVVITNAAC